MLKVIVWIVVVFTVLMGLRLLNVSKAARRARESRSSSGQVPAAQTMVRCARCGVYLPRADARVAADGMVCTDPGCAKPQG